MAQITKRITTSELDAMSAVVDGVDAATKAQENKWGVGRLLLLVDVETREKMKRQMRRFDEAIALHDVERVRQAGAAMIRGWETLDAKATQAGARPLEPQIWEIRLSDGRVAALCRSSADAYSATRSGRWLEVWTIDEIARVIENFPEISKAKEVFPGAVVERATAKRVPHPDDLPDEEEAGLPAEIRF